MEAEVELEACNVEYISECMSCVVVRAHELLVLVILELCFMNSYYYYYC